MRVSRKEVLDWVKDRDGFVAYMKDKALLSPQTDTYHEESFLVEDVPGNYPSVVVRSLRDGHTRHMSVHDIQSKVFYGQLVILSREERALRELGSR